MQTLPQSLQKPLSPYVTETCPDDITQLVKAADLLSAYVKCIQEIQSGNNEFKDAMADVETRLDAINLPEVNYFKDHFLPAVHLTVDQLYDKPTKP